MMATPALICRIRQLSATLPMLANCTSVWWLQGSGPPSLAASADSATVASSVLPMSLTHARASHGLSDMRKPKPMVTSIIRKCTSARGLRGAIPQILTSMEANHMMTALSMLSKAERTVTANARGSDDAHWVMATMLRCLSKRTHEIDARLCVAILAYLSALSQVGSVRTPNLKNMVSEFVRRRAETLVTELTDDMAGNKMILPNSPAETLARVLKSAALCGVSDRQIFTPAVSWTMGRISAPYSPQSTMPIAFMVDVFEASLIAGFKDANFSKLATEKLSSWVLLENSGGSSAVSHAKSSDGRGNNDDGSAMVPSFRALAADNISNGDFFVASDHPRADAHSTEEMSALSASSSKVSDTPITEYKTRISNEPKAMSQQGATEAVANMTASRLCAALWALVRSGVNKPALFDALIRQIMVKIEANNSEDLVKSTDLARLAWATGYLGNGNADLVDQIAMAAIPELNWFQAQDLRRLLWGLSQHVKECGSVSHTLEFFLTKVCDATGPHSPISLSALRTCDLAEILQSFVTMRFYHRALVSYVLDLVWRSTRRFSSDDLRSRNNTRRSEQEDLLGDASHTEDHLHGIHKGHLRSRDESSYKPDDLRDAQHIDPGDLVRVLKSCTLLSHYDLQIALMTADAVISAAEPYVDSIRNAPSIKGSGTISNGNPSTDRQRGQSDPQDTDGGSVRSGAIHEDTEALRTLSSQLADVAWSLAAHSNHLQTSNTAADPGPSVTSDPPSSQVVTEPSSQNDWPMDSQVPEDSGQLLPPARQLQGREDSILQRLVHICSLAPLVPLRAWTTASLSRMSETYDHLRQLPSLHDTGLVQGSPGPEDTRREGSRDRRLGEVEDVWTQSGFLEACKAAQIRLKLARRT